MPKPSPLLVSTVTSSRVESVGAPAVRGARLESDSPRRRRRVFTAQEKLCILKHADAAIASGERGALEALMRQRGLYSPDFVRHAHAAMP